MLVQGKQCDYVLNHQGALVYLDGDGDLNVTLIRVEPAGGQFLLPKMFSGKDGWTALIEDTEGNQLGLGSME